MPMSDETLKAILSAKIQNSIGYQGGKLAKQRQLAQAYYNGEPFGNEVEYRSQVVSRDVAEAVDSAMPNLMKMFASGDEIVRFDPTEEADEEKAAQATDYVNWIFSVQNPGYRLLYEGFKDALLFKNGVWKVWWDEQTSVERETYRGLTDAEFAELLNDPDIEPVEHTAYPDPMAPPVPMMAPEAPPAAPGQPPMTMGMPGLPPDASGLETALGGAVAMPPQEMPLPMLHDVAVQRKFKDGRVKICTLAPDEFLIDRRATDLDDVPFCAHRVKKTITDLLEMGYPRDVVEGLGGDEEHDFSLERLERFKGEDEMPYRGSSSLDKSMREVWIYECYIRVDYADRGVAEWRKVTLAGSEGYTILDNEPVDDHPFASITPNIIPHKFWGKSLADDTMDIQEVKSALWRQTLDNLYLSNAPQREVVADQVNLNDLLTSRPGGLVRVKQPGMVRDLAVPFVAGNSFQMLEYIDTQREQRTGITRYNQGMDADTLNHSATGMNLITDAAQSRQELIARTFAETGVKALFRKILKLVCKYQQRPRIIKLRGKWTPMDPREWKTSYDLTVTVGLGTGNRQQQMQHYAAIAQKQEQIIMQAGPDNALCGLKEYYNTLAKMIEAAGLKTADPYFKDPASAPPQQPQQPQPDPEMAKAQMQMQIEQQKAQHKMQVEQQQLAADIEMARQKAQAQIAVEQMQAQARIEVERQRAAAEAELMRLKAQHQAALDEHKALLQAQPAMPAAPVPPVM